MPLYYILLIISICHCQVTQWLNGMRQQLASNHGNIGDSLTAVEKLSGEHEKFSETAKVSDMSFYHLHVLYSSWNKCIICSPNPFKIVS